MQTKWWKAVFYLAGGNTHRVLVGEEAQIKEMLETWRGKVAGGMENDVVTFEGMSDTFDRAYDAISCRAEDVMAMVIYPLTYG